MKRRKFLAAATLLSFVGADAWAAKKKAAPTKHGSKKTAGKGKPSKHSGPTAHTADAPVTEKPPVGSSASRLPPVKAPEPPAEWRTYEVTTTLKLKKSPGRTRLWLPLPMNQDTLYQRTLGHSWKDNADIAGLRRLPDGNLETYYCEWAENVEPRLELTTTVTTADRHFDVTKRTVAPEREDILRYNLQATSLIPNDSLAFHLGERIIGRIKDPVAQAKAIYDWVVDNADYDPAIPHCGTGNVKSQLAEGRYGGRSADINGLFVALCRATGIPARCVYGQRVGGSRLLRSLGLADNDASRGQHVRAEFYIPGYGWIPVDPSDVRRAVALEGLSERDSKFASLRKVLFGVWEMNWVAYNVGSDLILPGSQAALPNLPFFLYPQQEGAGGGLSALRPGDNLTYSIAARRVEL